MKNLIIKIYNYYFLYTDNTDIIFVTFSLISVNVGLSIGVPVTLTVLFVVSCPLCILFIASRTKWRRRRRVVSYSVATNPSLHTEETLVNYQRLLNGASESINATGSAAQHEAPPPYPGTGYYEDTEVQLILYVYEIFNDNVFSRKIFSDFTFQKNVCVIIRQGSRS